MVEPSDPARMTMWRWQRAFQGAVDVAARNAFRALDDALDARGFLVGFRTQGPPGQDPDIVVEPESLGYGVSIFQPVPDLAHCLYQDDPEHSPSALEPSKPRQHDPARFRSWRRAVERVMAAEDREAPWRSFASWPAEVGPYRVVCVLQIARRAADAYYALTQERVDEFEHLPRSLIEALVDVFLTDCRKALQRPQPGRSRRVLDSTRAELHRNAGRALMQRLAWVCRSYETVPAIYDAVCDLSAARYEGAPTVGSVLVSARGHPNVQELVLFQRPVALEDTKGARKLLQVATQEVLPLCQGAELYGLGRLTGTYDAQREDLFVVEFLEREAWQLTHADRVLMRVQHGLPSLPGQPLDETNLAATLRRVFPGAGDQTLLALQSLARAAARQERGTTVVISDHAAEEARRLAGQSTLIRPVALTPGLVHALSAIDGALLADPRGTCHAIGVILDGLACAKGAADRGARYNSAVRYVETAAKQFGHRCAVVVVSEDGLIDVLPELPPQIPRRTVAEQMEAFAALRERPPVSRRDFNRFMRWFSDHKLYLSEEAAERINAIRRRLEPLLEASDTSILWRELTGNPDLDASYFTDEDADAPGEGTPAE